jgi:hypothetical protein
MDRPDPLPYAGPSTPHPRQSSVRPLSHDSRTQWGIARVVVEQGGTRVRLAPAPVGRTKAIALGITAIVAGPVVGGLIVALVRPEEGARVIVLSFCAAGIVTGLLQLAFAMSLYRRNDRGDFLIIDFRDDVVRLPRLNRVLPRGRLLRLEMVSAFTVTNPGEPNCTRFLLVIRG